ncbi:MAG: hypothetical protein K2X39_04330 [Silvanigrellaceae bacterium]|nr:hypothetical protein [Silvanigrellaceae bacterium]
MSSAALTWLQRKGMQDSFLTQDPEVTPWRFQFKRYTNFSFKVEELTFNGSGAGKTLSLLIPKGADLLSNLMAVFKLPAIVPDYANGSTAVSWVANVGQVGIQEIRFDAGGATLLRVFGEQLVIDSELNGSSQHDLAEMVGRYKTRAALIQRAKSPSVLYVPLGMYFSETPGLAYPLINSQYTDLKVTVMLRPMSQLWLSYGNPQAVPLIKGTCKQVSDTDLHMSLFGKFVYLEGRERMTFAKNMSEQLIVQNQTTGEHYFQINGSQNNVQKVLLNYSHPVKYITWVIQSSTAKQQKNWSNYASESGTHLLSSANLRIENDPLYAQNKGANFFHNVIPYCHFNKQPELAIYAISFANNASTVVPEGTLNWSRVDNITLDLVLSKEASEVNKGRHPDDCVTYSITSYAKNYNVARFISGLVGIAYS